MTTTPTTEVAVVDRFSDAERYALVAFLAGYRGLTREAYALDLRQFVAWCEEHDLRLFGVRRADIECFARDLEARGRARATVARRLCTVAGFYRYAEQERLLERSPAAHVRRPRLDYESHAAGLDRNEVGALLVAAGLASASEHALVSLLAINGLRVSEALGTDIEALGLERGHRTLTVLRKGGKVVTIPLAPNGSRDRSSSAVTGNGWIGTPLGASRGASPKGRHQQAGRPAHAPPRVHHRCPRRWGALARRARSREPRRPADDDALRPRPRVARPARHLRRRGLPRGRRPLTARGRRRSAGLEVPAECLAHDLRRGRLVRSSTFIQGAPQLRLKADREGLGRR
jgi:Phage integrase, N-terminal SAM-like domain